MEHTLNKFLFIILPNLTCFFWEKNRHFIVLVHLVYPVRNDNVIDIEAILNDVGMPRFICDPFNYTPYVADKEI